MPVGQSEFWALTWQLVEEAEYLNKCSACRQDMYYTRHKRFVWHYETSSILHS